MNDVGNSEVIRKTNEIPRKSGADEQVQSKSKFVVTRAVDPLHLNKNCNWKKAFSEAQLNFVA